MDPRVRRRIPPGSTRIWLLEVAATGRAFALGITNSTAELCQCLFPRFNADTCRSADGPTPEVFAAPPGMARKGAKLPTVAAVTIVTMGAKATLLVSGPAGVGR